MRNLFYYIALALKSFTAQRATITTKQSYSVTNAALQSAILYPTFNVGALYGNETDAAGTAIATGNRTVFEKVVDTRLGPFDFM